MKKFASIQCSLVSGILALLSLVPASAQAINVGAARWSADGVPGYGSCEEALELGLERARAVNNDPLVFVGADCAQAKPTGVWPDFDADYRRTFDFPTTPNRAVRVTAYCDVGGLTITAPPAREVTCTAPDPALGKIAGQCPYCQQLVGDPIDPGSGNSFQTEMDYAGSGPFPLRFERAHNSLRAKRLTNSAGLGSNWTHTYMRRLALSDSPGANIVAVSASRPDGKTVDFNLSGSSYLTDPDRRDFQLVRLANSWKLISPDDEIETYDSAGRLVSIANRAGLTQTLSYFTTGLNAGRLQTVTDAFGRTLAFAYNANGLLTTLTIPGGGTFTYTYNILPGTGDQQLLTATDPMGRIRTYIYEGPIPGGFFRMLTGITDELGVRYATWTYDMDLNSSFQGRATGSQHFGGAGKITISYTGGVTTVTTFVSATLSATRTYGFQTNFGVVGNNAVTGPACPQCGPSQTFYNAPTGLVSSWVDWNQNQGNRSFDSVRNLEIARVDGNTNIGGFGTPTADTFFVLRQWHPTFRLPTLITEPLRTTTNIYDADGTACGARGALCSKSIQATTNANGNSGGSNVGAPRVWTYTYNADGQVLTANGPRTDVSDVTTYTYDAQGNLATITNALGQTTQITAYNVHDQPLTVVDPNGLTTTLTYDGRQRLTSRDVGSETTTYTYDAAGQLTKVTLPDNSFFSYSYDGAHRLTGIQDNLGNRIAYTLDLAGNRTKEEVFDPSNALAQTRSRAYSNINRLFQELGAANQTTEYTYDLQGNVTSMKDPLNRITANQYDTRNRMRQVTDPAAGVTQYGLNGLSALTSVKDPRNLTTTYAVDGLGNLNQQVSPDTGTTANIYDLAGNLATQTDAKGQVTAYAYDALNRVSLITFHDGSKQAYAYDQGTNGVGRLTSIAETDSANQTTSLIAYGYDQHGRVTSETRTVGGVVYTLAYFYDAAGRMTGMTYPSGRTVSYALDALGRVNQVTTTKDSQSLVVVQNVQFHPFGGAKSWTLGNGQVYSRAIDQDGRIASYTLGSANYDIGFDAASRITGIAQTGNPANTNTYGYDTLDRLSSAVLPSSNFGYSYDAVGNRLTKTVGANTDTYTYGATSNRIASLTPSGSPPRSFIFDANGSTTNDALNQYSYDTRGRMVQTVSTVGATTYQVNALGQRIRKVNGSGDTVFTYDTTGKLIAESDPAGVLKREYLYLGDIPVGVVQ